MNHLIIRIGLISTLGFLVFLQNYMIVNSLFRQFPNAGIAFHIIGGCSIVLLLYSFFHDFSLRKQYTYILAATIFIAVAWEFFEYFWGWNYKRTLYNLFTEGTIDVFVGFIGAAIGCLIIHMCNRIR